MSLIRKTIEKDEQYLKQISEVVDLNNKEYLLDIEKLSDFCLNNECFALASIQIGIPKRIIYLKNTTLDVPIDNKKYSESKILINPIVISKKGITTFWEACLSCLNYVGLVRRPYEIEVEYFDEQGRKRNQSFKGFESTVLSHELDHLDGILHINIADEIIELPPSERKQYREIHPYNVISKDCDYDKIIYKNKK